MQKSETEGCRSNDRLFERPRDKLYAMTGTTEITMAISELIEPRLGELCEICRQLGVVHLDIFGSAVTGRFDAGRSDLDFLVEFVALSPGRYARSCFELRTSLERLFERPIDLMTRAALVNPYLRRQVEAEAYRLYPLP